MASDAAENTNLVLIRKSRPTLRAGDIFSFRLLDGPYRFGRIMMVDVQDAPIAGAHLVYVYEATSDDLTPPRSQLTPDRLLTGPIWTNRQGWLRGYFVTVDHGEVSDGDWLAQHCFLRVVLGRRTHVDLHGNRLPVPLEPCGQWGVASHRGMDDQVSEALGLPLAPD